jgi:hypothetical protein
VLGWLEERRHAMIAQANLLTGVGIVEGAGRR